MAQSSVTLYGVMDAGYVRGTASGVGSNDMNAIGSGGLSSSRLGFRGTEDLGGGLAASFVLEAGINSDDGTGSATNTTNVASTKTTNTGLTFNRRSTLSLESKSLGELRLGRDYHAAMTGVAGIDPFGAVGVGRSLAYLGATDNLQGGSTGLRVSNSVSYFTPNTLGGFYGQVQLGLAEKASNLADNGGHSAVRLGWANGPIDVSLATSVTNLVTGDVKSSNLGGSYDLGVAKVMAVVSRDKNETTALTGKGLLIGALVPMGVGQIRVAYSRYEMGTPESDKFALGYVYNLSKRTALYTTVARISNSGGAKRAEGGATAGANGSSTGYDFGIKHSF
jgi:predicted porin